MEETTVCDLLLRAEVIITQNAGREVVRDGGVAVRGGMILAVGPWEELKAAYAAAEVLDLGRALVMPGLVNTHTHVSMTLLRGLADDLPLMEWLQEHIFPVETRIGPEYVHLGALLGCAEMIRTGTTFLGDMYLIEPEVAKAVDVTGLRGLLGEVIFAFPSRSYGDLDEALAFVRDFQAQYAGHERIGTAVMPHAVYTTTPELLTRTRELSRELGVPWEIHLAETQTETAQCLEKFGQRPVAYLDGLGLLGPDALLAHCVDLTPEEIWILAASGSKVLHNPESNMKLASGICPVPELIGAGACVSLGTDGAASNNNLNMFGEMASAALLQKVRLLDPTTVCAQTALDMATLNGAAALHRPELGRLEAGCPADLVALDLTEPNMQPLYNPVSQVVYAASGGEVRLSMVAGRILYQDGRYLTLDYDGLLREVASMRKWVLGNS